jgi:glyoxylase-like metal-dependent hydrolase (beta-lactamase superfamily II)
MTLRSLVVGALETNAYLLVHDSRDALLIDPGGDAEAILALLAREKANLRSIVLTHAHADHIGAAAAVQRATGAPILLHEADAALLADPMLSLAAWTGADTEGLRVGRHLGHGDRVEISPADPRDALRVLHTPGHTPGSISLLGDGVVFTGDTLFAQGVGRTDFPGGSADDLFASIREQLLTLPEATVVYPGHGPRTTIGDEKRLNPFL